MSLKEQISNEIKSSLKAGDKEVVSVLRMLNSKILEKEVSLRSTRGRNYQLNDEEVIEVVASYGKQRKQSIDSYREAGREDLALKEEKELAILKRFLPEQLSREDVERIVVESISESGAETVKDLGKVMRIIMPKLKGAADGKLVNQIVREKLGS
jgi:uncharacterized protein YqeY